MGSTIICTNRNHLSLALFSIIPKPFTDQHKWPSLVAFMLPFGKGVGLISVFICEVSEGKPKNISQRTARENEVFLSLANKCFTALK